MRGYARFNQLTLLPLDLLEREIQVESRWYSSDIYDLFHTEVIDSTTRLEARLMHPVLVRSHTRKIRCEEPRPMLPLMAWLIKASTLYSITTEDSTQAKVRTQIDSSAWDYDPNTDRIDWLWGQRTGWFDITGLWGVAGSEIQERDNILEEYVVDGSVIAGATSLVLTAAPTLEGGEIFYDPTAKQMLVVASASGNTLTLDQWGVPDRAVADQEELILCGRIHPTFERFILLDAFLQAWRRVSPLPPHSARRAQTFDGDKFDREAPSEVLSAVEEWERLLDTITGRLRPMRML